MNTHDKINELWRIHSNKDGRHQMDYQEFILAVTPLIDSATKDAIGFAEWCQIESGDLQDGKWLVWVNGKWVDKTTSQMLVEYKKQMP